MTDNSFQDEVVIITGASSGIGRQLALQLADRGALLSLAARSDEKLNSVAAECRERGARVLAVPTDVGEEAACKGLIDGTVAEFGRINVLINNAGIGMESRFDALEDLSVPEKLMRINYFGSLYTTYYALPHLKKTKGRIVAVSSLSGLVGVPTRSAYVASKFAMTGFFDSLRIELADEGVTVTTAYPDWVATNIRRQALGHDGRRKRSSNVKEKELMSAERAAEIILEAAEKRKRQVIMSLRGIASQWGKLLVPGLLERLTVRTLRRGK